MPLTMLLRIVILIAAWVGASGALVKVQLTKDKPFLLESPNYPDPPPGSVRETWDIRTEPGRVVLLTCQDVRLPTNEDCDYMYIFDGKVMTGYCGENKNLVKKSYDNEMTVRLTGEAVGQGGVKCVATSEVKISYDKYYQFVSEEIDSDEHGQTSGDTPVSCPCGWTNKGRIVNGKETKMHEYPLVVGLTKRSLDYIFCGGSIVTNYHVLTAAHCTQGKRASELAIFAGEHDTTTKRETKATVKVNVKEIIQHENYVHFIFHNDIALLVLEKKLEFNEFVGPVCLPSGPHNLVNDYIKVLGWGRTQHKGSSSDVLRKVNLRVLPLEACEERFPSFKIPLNERKQLCTFGHNKDSCQGDSGGPLIWLDPQTNRYTQVALVSYGGACASSDPGVNTDVFFYMPWIKEKIKASNPEGQICSKKIM